jgi:hypothetical protein
MTALRVVLITAMLSVLAIDASMAQSSAGQQSDRGSSSGTCRNGTGGCGAHLDRRATFDLLCDLWVPNTAAPLLVKVSVSTLCDKAGGPLQGDCAKSRTR